MNKLWLCAKAFRSLISTEYSIVLGKKGKTKNIKITFESDQFHHLLGLHKLSDLRIARADRSQILNKAIAGKISFEELEVSRYFCDIANRFNSFHDIEKILDDNNAVYHYNKLKASSQIDAKYLLSTKYKNQTIYLFIDKKIDEDTYFCRSFFQHENFDYTKNQAVYKLLYKEKKNLYTGETCILFKHKNYNPE